MQNQFKSVCELITVTGLDESTNFSAHVCLSQFKGGKKTAERSAASQTFASRAINLDKLPGLEPGLPPNVRGAGQDSTPPTHTHTHTHTHSPSFTLHSHPQCQTKPD